MQYRIGLPGVNSLQYTTNRFDLHGSQVPVTVTISDWMRSAATARSKMWLKSGMSMSLLKC